MTFNKRRYNALSVADNLIAMFLVFPFTLMYFRGIWDLLGHYILPAYVPLNYWIMTLIGLFQMVGIITLPYVQKLRDTPTLFPKYKHAKNVEFWIISRVYMYLHTLTNMSYWHGFWMLGNHYLGTYWVHNIIGLILCWFLASLLGGCRTAIWPPFFINIDTSDAFQLSARFDSKWKRGKRAEYVSDAFLTQIIMLSLSVLCWRSSLNIMEELIYPGERVKSDGITAIAGFIGCSILLAIQVPLANVSKKLENSRPFLRIVWEDCMYFITFICLTLLWRGIWNLNVTFMIPEMPLGGWVNHLAGTCGLLLMQTFTEVSAFGMTRDGTDPDGGAFYPNYYLRVFWKKSFDDSNKEEGSGLCPISVGYKKRNTDDKSPETEKALVIKEQLKETVA